MPLNLYPPLWRGVSSPPPRHGGIKNEVIMFDQILERLNACQEKADNSNVPYSLVLLWVMLLKHTFIEHESVNANDSILKISTILQDENIQIQNIDKVEILEKFILFLYNNDSVNDNIIRKNRISKHIMEFVPNVCIRDLEVIKNNGREYFGQFVVSIEEDTKMIERKTKEIYG